MASGQHSLPDTKIEITVSPFLPVTTVMNTGQPVEGQTLYVGFLPYLESPKIQSSPMTP
jgi:hypothetical protein